MRLINIHFLPRSFCASVVLVLVYADPRLLRSYPVFLVFTKNVLVICSICIKIISYNFLDLVHKLLVRTGHISDKRHSDFFLQIDTTSIAENFTQYAVTVHSQRLRLF